MRRRISSRFLSESSGMPKLGKIDRLAHYIGHVTLQWNNVQFWYFILFKTLLLDLAGPAHSLFFSAKSDRGQRDMLQHLAAFEMENHPDLLAEMIALIERGNKLAGKRNAILHAMWNFGKRGVPPSVHLPRHNRLHGKDAEEEFIDVLNSLVALESDLIAYEKKMSAIIRAQRAGETRKVILQAAAKGLRPQPQGPTGKAKTRRSDRKGK